MTDKREAILVRLLGIYLGCATSLSRGREIIGDIGLNFAITYRLGPAGL